MTMMLTGETSWLTLGLLGGGKTAIRTVSTIVILMIAILLGVLSPETYRSGSWAANVWTSRHIVGTPFSKISQVR